MWLWCAATVDRRASSTAWVRTARKCASARSARNRSTSRGGRIEGTMIPRLKERYQKEVVPALVKEFNYSNVNAVPRLRKIVVNMGLGEAIQNAKLLDSASNELGQITGQKPVITRARKSIANFK